MTEGSAIFIIAFFAGITALVIFFVLDRRKGPPARTKEKDLSRKKDPPGTGEEKRSARGPGEMLDYTVYKMPLQERIMYIALAAALFYAIGMTFYDNSYVALVLTIPALFYPRYRARQIAARRREDLSFQFKQALYSLNSSLSAGRSVENAFREVLNDLRLLYPNPDTFIIKEFEYIVHRLDNGEPIADAVEGFSRRTGVEDITNFTEVFLTFKRKGGNLNDVIRRTSRIIGDKLSIKQDISVMIAQKRFEAQILVVAPLIMVGILKLSSYEYMEPLYQVYTYCAETGDKFLSSGPFVMTFALIGIVLIYFWIQKIIDIKV